MSSALHLKLFGSPETTLDNRPIEGFITVKSRALLYYLAMKPGAHGRQILATLLWPESSETAAGKNLRNILSNLRQLVGSHLDITRQTVAFRRDASYSLDVEQFAALLEQYRRGRQDISDLENAVSLYAGDFLDGFYVPESDLYEIWMAAEREQLKQAQLAALYTAAARHAAQGEFYTSLDYASRLLALDNLSESGYQLRMSALAQAGQRNEALAQYHNLCRLLDEELGVAPLPETTTLYEQIKTGVYESAAGPSEARQTPVARQLAGLRPGKPVPEQSQIIDWGEIPAPASFYGRQEQLRQLQEWVLDEQSRLIAIMGIGGVGKSALAARFARGLVIPEQDDFAAQDMGRPQSSFDYILWRSLVNAPPLAVIMRDWLILLSGQRLVEIPDNVAEQLNLLMAYSRKMRCLFILDNFESLMMDQAGAGEFRQGYDEYGRLLQRFGDSEHQSCLLITSRELPRVFLRMQQSAAHTRSLRLPGLPENIGLSLLRAQGLSGPDTQLAELVQRYSGNPLALNLVAHTIQTLLGGDIDLLLEETTVFGDIRDVLDDQFDRLTPLEEQLLTWLAVEREPVDLRTISDDLVAKPTRRQLLEALSALHSRSLLEQTQEADRAGDQRTQRYALQNVVMEFITNRLVEAVCLEVEEAKVKWLHLVSLTKVQAKEYVQQSQRRLLLEPVSRWLADRLGSAGAEEKLHRLLDIVRVESALSQGYAGANLLHLLLAPGRELGDLDFAGMAIRQADLRNAILHNVSFRDCDLSGTIFRGTFGVVVSVAFSPDGQLLAALSGDGTIAFWRLYEHQPHLIIRRESGSDFAMAIRPDGQQVACGGNDRAIRVWDAQTGLEIHRLIGHTGAITSVAYSPDSSRLYSSSDDLTIGVWDTSSGRLLRQIPAPDILTLALAASPDGQFLAAVGFDGKARLWKTETWALRRRLDFGHTKKIRTVAFSPDGKTVATGDEDNSVDVWHVKSGKRLASLRLHSSIVLSVAYHPDGITLASASADKSVRLWNWREERRLHVLQGGRNWVTSVAFSPDGQLLASGSYDSTIRLWESKSGQLLHVLRGSLKQVNEVVYSPDGALLATASFDQPVRLWDAESGRLLHSFHGHAGTVRRLAVSPDNRTLIVSGDDSTIWFWDIPTGKLRRTLSVSHPFVRTLALSPNGQLLAIGAGLGQGTLYVGDTTTLHLRPRDEQVRAGLAASICFSPEGQFIVYSDHASRLKVLNVRDDSVSTVSTEHEALIGIIRFSPDGSRLASQDRNGTLILWQVGNDGSLLPLTRRSGCGPSANYWNLSYSPAGEFMAFQKDGGNIGILETGSGQLYRTIAESLYGERCLAFGPDGSMLITASEEGRLRLWDVTTGECNSTLQEGVTGTLAVNPKNRRIASSGDDGAIRIWDLRSGSCERVLVQPGPYEGMDIAGAKGLSPAQVMTLEALGAVRGVR